MLFKKIQLIEKDKKYTTKNIGGMLSKGITIYVSYDFVNAC